MIAFGDEDIGNDQQALGHRICDDRIAAYISVDLFNQDSLRIVNAIAPETGGAFPIRMTL